MPGRLSIPVSQKEWQLANQLLKRQPPGTKLKRTEESRILHSFICFYEPNRQKPSIYAYDVGNYLGKGGYGKAKYVLREDGKTFVVKITFPENSLKGMPFPENLWKYLGLIKEVDASNQYEQEAALDLGIALHVGKRTDCDKQVTIMHDLGVPLKKHIQQNSINRCDALILAFRTIKALYDFHIGLKSKSRQRRLNNDIKNANVLIKPETGELSIIDLGEAFDIEQTDYDECENFRHPRAASIEPDLVAPEIASQLGQWWEPWNRYAHGSRLFSQKSDVYLLGNVIAELAPFNADVKRIKDLMLATQPENRPSMPVMLISILALFKDFDSNFEEFKAEYLASFEILPGFSEMMDFDVIKANALASVVLYSDANISRYNDKLFLHRLSEGGILSKALSRLFLFIRQAKDVSDRQLATRLIQLISADKHIAKASDRDIAKRLAAFLEPSTPSFCVRWFNTEDSENGSKQRLKIALLDLLPNEAIQHSLS